MRRAPDPRAPKRFMVGKVPYDGGRNDYTDLAGMGSCEITQIKAYGPATP